MGTVFCRFLKQQNFCQGVQLFDLWLEKSESQTVIIQIVNFLKTQSSIFKWWLIIALGENLPKSSILINHIYFFKKKRYKVSGLPLKSQTVWKNPQKCISVDKTYFYCIFVMKKVWQKYCLFMQRRWLSGISSFSSFNFMVHNIWTIFILPESIYRRARTK